MESKVPSQPSVSPDINCDFPAMDFPAMDSVKDAPAVASVPKTTPVDSKVTSETEFPQMKTESKDTPVVAVVNEERQKIRAKMYKKSAYWTIHFFPFDFAQEDIDHPMKFLPFALGYEQTRQTGEVQPHWLFKPRFMLDCIHVDEQLSDKKLNKFFYRMGECNRRDTKSGPDQQIGTVSKTFPDKKFPHVYLFGFGLPSWPSRSFVEKVEELKVFLSNAETQNDYYASAANAGMSPDKYQPLVVPGATFWTSLVQEENIKIVEHASLDAFFLRSTIVSIVENSFRGLTSNYTTWPRSVKKYAFGTVE
jgi:hypothetical protein